MGNTKLKKSAALDVGSTKRLRRCVPAVVLRVSFRYHVIYWSDVDALTELPGISIGPCRERFIVKMATWETCIRKSKQM